MASTNPPPASAEVDEHKDSTPEISNQTSTEEKATSPDPQTMGTPLAQQETSTSVELPYGPTRTDTTTALRQAENPPTPPVPPIPTSTTDRDVSTAIGPSSDQPATLSKTADETGPILMITLLLTNGARHPFKLDGKYLSKRGVDVSANNPYNLSVYKLKELILREWRDEWESKPSSPSAIRLISFGKLLDDKSAINDLRFSHDSANVLHMTIKPQDFIEDEDTKGAKASRVHSREAAESRSPRCRCVIM